MSINNRKQETNINNKTNHKNTQKLSIENSHSDHNDSPMFASQKHRLFDKKHFNYLMNNRGQTFKKNVTDVFNLKNDNGYRDLKPATNNLLGKLKTLSISYPNCADFLSFVEKNVALAFYNEFREITIPPILLVGQPGIGKTAVIRKLVALMNMKYTQIDCATVSAGFVISGASSNWKDGKPGVIANTLRDSEFANPFVVFDEIEKMNGAREYDPYGSLYTLFEEESAKSFKDEFIPDLSFDASKINFIATANSIETIPEPILSRLTVIQIDSLEKEQAETVVKSIYKDLRANIHHNARFSDTLRDDIIEELSFYTPREMKQALKRGLANAAYRFSCYKTNKLIKLHPLDIGHVEQKQDNPIGFVW